MLYFTDMGFVLISDAPPEEIGDDYTSFLVFNSSELNDSRIKNILDKYYIKEYNNTEKDSNEIKSEIRELAYQLEDFLNFKCLHWDEDPDEIIEKFYRGNKDAFYADPWYVNPKFVFHNFGNAFVYNIGGK